MGRLGIYFFFGTGNTEIVTRLVEQSFAARGWAVNVIRMEDVNNGTQELNIQQYDLVGFGSQVIGFGIPKVVSRFAKKLPMVSDNKKAFIFRTAGGVAPINYNVSKKLMRMLKSKQYDVCYEQIFSIGSNWMIKFDDVIMKQLYRATTRKITQMCEAIESGEWHYYYTGTALRIKMGIVSTFAAMIFPLLGKDVVVEKSCSQCGLCVSNCPAKNICIKNGKIKFHSSCSACLRCVYTCPKKAIHFRLFSFITLPDGYDVKKSLSEKGNYDEKPNGKIPAFFKSYVEE